MSALVLRSGYLKRSRYVAGDCIIGSAVRDLSTAFDEALSSAIQSYAFVMNTASTTPNLLEQLRRVLAAEKPRVHFPQQICAASWALIRFVRL